MTDVTGAVCGDAIIEMELCVNQRLYENGYITTEMYEKAKTILLNKCGAS